VENWFSFFGDSKYLFWIGYISLYINYIIHNYYLFIFLNFEASTAWLLAWFYCGVRMVLNMCICGDDFFHLNSVTELPEWLYTYTHPETIVTPADAWPLYILWLRTTSAPHQAKLFYSYVTYISLVYIFRHFKKW